MINIPVQSYFHSLISKRRFSKDTDVRASCIQLLNFLVSVENLDIEYSYSLDDLRDQVSLEIDDEDFIYSVFYLTNPEVNVLKQGFYAWRDIEENFVPVNSEDVIEMLNSKNYYNPHSGEALSEEDFLDQIVTFFSPTTYFLEKRND
ncbi:hypothetical protein [Acinetobacter courvalinii]|uniref:hypothetical protein n=1 Tax=Acinetobacter courvalinii TaxID=280147 RepID=UPI00289F091E|nr:hypothetical protein [Acinetobacter courvalinii]